jgi:hypothetical protein
MTGAEARARRAAEHKARRALEHACALDFLVFGDDEERGRHAERCICSPPCSRNYDPAPYAEAEPRDARMYEDTAIGALYGLSPMTPYMAAQLRGWNVLPRGGVERTARDHAKRGEAL